MRIQAVDRVPFGSPALVHLSAVPGKPDAPGVALALAAHGLSLRAARGVAVRLSDDGRAVVALPGVESAEALADALAACGVRAEPYGTPAKIDVRAIRDGLGLSQEDFALTFGLDHASVRDWEQGRSRPDTATRSFLLTIRTHPDIVRDTLRDNARREVAE